MQLCKTLKFKIYTS